MSSKKVLRGEALAAALGVNLSSSEDVSDPDTRPISGTYDASGRNPDGSFYGATVDILEGETEVHVTWWSGPNSYEGRGTRTGRLLVIEWHQVFPVTFVIMADGTLHGTWFDGRALEKLVPQ